jgi:fido (protein-threonine AMPylation protein)
MPLTLRQQSILKVLTTKPLSTTGLINEISRIGFEISEDTLQRELKQLLAFNFVNSSGSGPSRLHDLTTLGRLHVVYSDQDIDAWFNNNDRAAVRYRLDIAVAISNYLAQDLFNNATQSIVAKYRQFVASLDKDTLRRWQQKWLIEFAWKSSAIEGNSYSELETETLLLDKIEAGGKSHNEAVMIVNHQTAYDFIRANKASFKQITLEQVLKIHELLAKDLDVSFGIRKSPVRISGSKYIPLAHQQQLKDNLEKIIYAINQINEPLNKALSSVLLIAYLQPFIDGNKRTSRVLANGILESYNYPPLTFGNIEPTNYRRACIAFYELTDIRPMVRIITDSYKNIGEFD